MATIAIVGNATSLLDKDYGKLIDSHDKVVRFNQGVPIKPEAQGQRTDLVVTYHIDKWNKIKDEWPSDMNHFILSPYPFKPVYGIHPSTLMAYLLILPRGELEVSIFGVDNNVSKTFYSEKTYPHNWAAEKKLQTQMVEEIKEWRMYT